MKHLVERLNQVGFERTRRAIAALGLSLFVFLYLMLGTNAPSEWAPAFVALAACYGIAFMGVAAEWFWGRWFAIGLGWSGVMVAVFALMQLGWTPVLAIYGGIHGLVVTLLSGQKMADRFDLQTKWRESYGMDEHGVARLRKTVTRASASLPSVILWALAPKQPGQEVFAIATLVAGGLALTGLFGVIRMRAWGLLALAGAATAFVVGGVGAYPAAFNIDWVGFEGAWAYRGMMAGPALPTLLLAAALAPFVRPAIRFLRGLRV